MTPRLRTALTYGFSLVLAGLLLYLALRGVDLGAIAEALRAADYTWLLPLVAIAVFSHVLRAWRWQILVNALPEKARLEGSYPDHPTPPHRTSLKASFYSLMIGYMVNYAAPRFGEVARSVNLSAQSGLRLSSVLGTVVADRLLDITMLALALLSALVLLLDRFAVVDEVFFEPAREMLSGWPFALGLLALVLTLVVAYLLLRYAERLRPLWTSFKQGIQTLVKSPRRGTILATTLGMWLCYGVMAHLPFVILGMEGIYSISLLDSWIIMALGALGILVPSPGGIGSYHFITVQTLVYLFAVDAEPAATYAVLTHGAQFIVFGGIGLTCLLIQGIPVKALLGAIRGHREAGDKLKSDRS